MMVKRVGPLLEGKVGLLLFLLGHADREVSGGVVEFSHEYVSLLKQRAPLPQTERVFLKEILAALLRNYRLPDDFNHDKEVPLNN